MINNFFFFDKKLEALDVNICFNLKIDTSQGQPESGPVKAIGNKRSTEFNPDLIFWCIGLKPNVGWLNNTLKLNEFGRIDRYGHGIVIE